MLYFVCFIFWYSVIFDYFCNDFIVDLFTENKEIVIIIITWYIQHSPRAAEQPRTQLVSNTSRIIGDIQGGIPITAENQAHASAADSRKDTTINTL